MRSMCDVFQCFSSHFLILVIFYSLSNTGKCNGNEKIVPVVNFIKEPPKNTTIYVGNKLELTWVYEVRPKDKLRKASIGVTDKNGAMAKVLYVVRPKLVPPQIIFNPAYEEEYGKRVHFDEIPDTLELKNVTLKDRGYFGCELDVGKFQAVVRHAVYVHVVDVEVVRKPAGVTTPSEVSSWIDHKIKLNCKFRAKGPLSIRWEKWSENNTRVQANGIVDGEKDHSTLSIVTAQNENFGTYVCIGKTPSSTALHKILVKRLYQPGAPQHLKYYLTKYNNKKAIKLMWEPPKYTGGTPIQRFVVFKRLAGSGDWVQVRTSQFTLVYLTVSKEDEKQGFQVMVRAKNRVGLGPHSSIRRIRNLEGPKIMADSLSHAGWLKAHVWLMIIPWIITVNFVNW